MYNISNIEQVTELLSMNGFLKTLHERNMKLYLPDKSMVWAMLYARGSAIMLVIEVIKEKENQGTTVIDQDINGMYIEDFNDLLYKRKIINSLKVYSVSELHKIFAMDKETQEPEPQAEIKTQILEAKESSKTLVNLIIFTWLIVLTICLILK